MENIIEHNGCTVKKATFIFLGSRLIFVLTFTFVSMEYSDCNFEHLTIIVKPIKQNASASPSDGCLILIGCTVYLVKS